MSVCRKCPANLFALTLMLTSWHAICIFWCKYAYAAYLNGGVSTSTGALRGGVLGSAPLRLPMKFGKAQRVRPYETLTLERHVVADFAVRNDTSNTDLPSTLFWRLGRLAWMRLLTSVGAFKEKGAEPSMQAA